MSIKSFIRNYLWKTSEPWADIAYDGKQMVVRSYNDAFVKEQRQKLGDLVGDKADKDVVKLFLDRENIDREEPRLDVLHSGIEEDGRIKVKLDWNKSFIKHLSDHGITGETEEEAVENYLKLLTMNELEGADFDEFFSKSQLDEAFKDVDKQLEDEYNEALKQANKPKRRRQIKRH